MYILTFLVCYLLKKKYPNIKHVNPVTPDGLGVIMNEQLDLSLLSVMLWNGARGSSNVWLTYILSCFITIVLLALSILTFPLLYTFKQDRNDAKWSQNEKQKSALWQIRLDFVAIKQNACWTTSRSDPFNPSQRLPLLSLLPPAVVWNPVIFSAPMVKSTFWGLCPHTFCHLASFTFFFSNIYIIKLHFTVFQIYTFSDNPSTVRRRFAFQNPRIEKLHFFKTLKKYTATRDGHE